MAEITVKTVKLSEIKLNESNPRLISTKDMDRLVKSLREFPEMMELREIVVDETMMVLGGNARTLALRKIGAKECRAKIVTGLTEAQKREFMVKDNSSLGSWDMDLLAAWDNLPLVDWGVKIPEAWGKMDGPGDLQKNFTAGAGGAEEEEKESPAEANASGKYPVTFILDQSEWERWAAVKAGLKLQSDKAAFLKMIGGDHA